MKLLALWMTDWDIRDSEGRKPARRLLQCSRREVERGAEIRRVLNYRSSCEEAENLDEREFKMKE